MEREQTTIRLPEEMKREIQRQADRMGVSFNARLIMLIKKGLNQE